MIVIEYLLKFFNTELNKNSIRIGRLCDFVTRLCWFNFDDFGKIKFPTSNRRKWRQLDDSMRYNFKKLRILEFAFKPHSSNWIEIGLIIGRLLIPLLHSFGEILRKPFYNCRPVCKAFWWLINPYSDSNFLSFFIRFSHINTLVTKFPQSYLIYFWSRGE